MTTMVDPATVLVGYLVMDVEVEEWQTSRAEELGLIVRQDDRHMITMLGAWLSQASPN